ncbi:MAG TPA: diaminopimelate decarboxylase [Spirochaetota bacterium]|nr:diaminopimelate decarboxylase [Spirochaetota bacterium]HOM86879.1 diaminopimelate decarboxylase [Spirochaetota bacterium]HOR92809.1 diaminopimelate decarboxylase [Spirochaetota bacterium]HPK43564.1 diaminopimelate decarboxylase [Spirochaetota bacterium]HRR61052.1 diaminopimelate decarboxylase [Spirochaetota bacterium]
MNSFREYFVYRDDQLYCEDVSLADVARIYGTPLYVYSSKCFIDKFTLLDEALASVAHTICYSVKSNSNVSILKLMKDVGCGMDVVSGGELYRAIAAGVNPEKIVYAGVGKNVEEIEYALKTGIQMFNCESLSEIKRINNIAQNNNIVAHIAIRINPDVDANTHHYITTGKKENKFGISLQYLPELIKSVKSLPHIVLKGIHVHIGSQITQIEPFVEACKKAIAVIDDIQDMGMHECKTLNLGGGFGIQYNDEPSLDVALWAQNIVESIKKKNLFLIIEPGRFISGNSGALIMQVQYKKKTSHKTFIIVDSGMHHLIRPTLYQSYQYIANTTLREGEEVVDVVGPICESGDFFAKDRLLTKTEEGDYLAVLSAGAYGMAMASHYNSHPLPAEVLVEGSNYRLIRKRESYEDLIAKELV